MGKAYEDTIRVYDKLGKKYLKDSSKQPPVERDAFMKLLPKEAKILDAGCGGGRDVKEFVKNGFKATGIDLSETMIREAEQLVPKAGLKKMDILNLKLPSTSFDAVWANAVLLHLERRDVPKALRNFHKILKPGGVLHVRVKQGKGTAFIKEELSGWHTRFYTYFSKAEVERAMKKVGFKIIHTTILPDEFGRPDVKWIIVWGRKP